MIFYNNLYYANAPYIPHEVLASHVITEVNYIRTLLHHAYILAEGEGGGGCEVIILLMSVAYKTGYIYTPMTTMCIIQQQVKGYIYT